MRHYPLRLFSVVALWLVACGALAFPVSQNTCTTTVAKAKGNFDQFSWGWIGGNDQSNAVQVDVSLAGYNVAFKVSKYVATSSVPIAYVYQTNITIATSNLTWFTSRTNIPPDGTYNAELFAYEGSTTNYARTLAQGRIKVTHSLYRDEDGTFPYPNVTNMLDYLTIADAAATYVSDSELTVHTTNTLATGAHGGESDPVALAVIATNGPTVAQWQGSNATLNAGITNEAGVRAAADGLLVPKSETNGWEVGSHAAFVTETVTNGVNLVLTNHMAHGIAAAHAGWAAGTQAVYDAAIVPGTQALALATADAGSLGNVSNTVDGLVGAVGNISNSVDNIETGYIQTNHDGDVSLLRNVTIGPLDDNTELLVNGTFDTDLSGWETDGFVWQTQQAFCENPGSYLSQSISGIVSGRWYRVRGYVEGTGPLTVSFGGATVFGPAEALSFDTYVQAVSTNGFIAVNGMGGPVFLDYLSVVRGSPYSLTVNNTPLWNKPIARAGVIGVNNGQYCEQEAETGSEQVGLILGNIGATPDSTFDCTQRVLYRGGFIQGYINQSRRCAQYAWAQSRVQADIQTSLDTILDAEGNSSSIEGAVYLGAGIFVKPKGTGSRIQAIFSGTSSNVVFDHVSTWIGGNYSNGTNVNFYGTGTIVQAFISAGDYQPVVQANESHMYGCGRLTNDRAVVVGNGQESHGNETLTVGGGVWHGTNRLATPTNSPSAGDIARYNTDGTAYYVAPPTTNYVTPAQYADGTGTVFVVGTNDTATRISAYSNSVSAALSSVLQSMTNWTPVESSSNYLAYNSATRVLSGCITNVGAGGSGFPLTEDGNLAGYSLTNGSFVGNGSGLTGIVAAVTAGVNSVTAQGNITNSGTAADPILDLSEPASNLLYGALQSAATSGIPESISALTETQANVVASFGVYSQRVDGLSGAFVNVSNWVTDVQVFTNGSALFTNLVRAAQTNDGYGGGADNLGDHVADSNLVMGVFSISIGDGYLTNTPTGLRLYWSRFDANTYDTVLTNAAGLVQEKWQWIGGTNNVL